MVECSSNVTVHVWTLLGQHHPVVCGPPCGCFAISLRVQCGSRQRRPRICMTNTHVRSFSGHFKGSWVKAINSPIVILFFASYHHLLVTAVMLLAAVFVSYGMVSMDSATLYINSDKISADVAQHLQHEGVEVKPYDALVDDVKDKAAGGATIAVDPSKVPYVCDCTFVFGIGSICSKRCQGSGNLVCFTYTHILPCMPMWYLMRCHVPVEVIRMCDIGRS